MSRKIPSATWAKVRKDYQKGQGSCAQLALKYGLNPQAVSTKCFRENWRNKKTKNEIKLDEKIDQALTKKAHTMAERAELFIKRSADEAEGWLDKIALAKRLLAEDDISGLKMLITAWQVPVQEGRRIYRLDENPPNQYIVNPMVMSMVLHPPRRSEPPKVVDVDARDEEDGKLEIKSSVGGNK